MKTITPPLSQREQTTRTLAKVSLLFLPLYCVADILFSDSENPLTRVLIIAGALATVTLALVAWITRDRAPAIVALLMPFASIGIGIVIFIFRAADSMRIG